MTDFHVDYENGNDANDGSDWANSFKTIAAATAVMDPGDRAKLAKSPDPVSIGNATWNHLSKTVTLAAALTLLVDDCESGWTLANGSTVTHPTTVRKSGAANVQITKSSYATGTLYAYKALAGVTDFSDYEALTLWIRADAAVADADRWVIALCSDTAGATPVDTFAVPAIATANRWTPVRLPRVGGGALGASIQSIAIYTGTSAPTNGQDILLDNINACTEFSLCSMISKSSSAGWSAEGWYGIQSIDGVTVLLDEHTNELATTGRGYYGTTETVETYRRETIALAAGEVVGETGVTISGGWDTGTDEQDGMTFCDGRGLVATLLSLAESTTLERVGAVRSAGIGVSLSSSPSCTLANIVAGNNGTYGVSLSSSPSCTLANVVASNNGTYGVAIFSTSPNNTLTDVVAGNNGNTGVYFADSPNCVLANVVAGNNGSVGVSISSSAPHCVLTDVAANNNGATGIAATGSPRCYGLTATGNATQQILCTYGARPVLYDEDLGETNVATFTAYADGFVTSHRHNGTDNTLIIADGGTWTQEDTDFDAPATASMWTALTSETTRDAAYPLWLSIAKVAVVADKLVTIKAIMRKAHATNADGGIRVLGGQIPGVAADVVATLADNTDEQELTITFTPTSAGVVEIEAWAAYVAGHAEVSIDRLSSVTQAA